MTNPDPVLKVEIKGLLHTAKLTTDSVISVVYYDGEKEWSMAKRFQIEINTLDERINFITDHSKSRCIYATTKSNIEIEYFFTRNKKKEEWRVVLDDFIDVKGWKARGNKLSDYVVKGVSEVDESETDAEVNENDSDLDNYQTGDTIEFEF